MIREQTEVCPMARPRLHVSEDALKCPQEIADVFARLQATMFQLLLLLPAPVHDAVPVRHIQIPKLVNSFLQIITIVGDVAIDSLTPLTLFILLLFQCITWK